MMIQNAYPEVINQYPKSSLGYKSNNLYRSFPPLMADGRSVISSWNTESSTNDQLKKMNSIQTNWDYRRYLTKNAVEVMSLNFNETANDTGFSFPPSSAPSAPPSSPYLYNSLNEQTQPQGYMESDLKNMYLSREQLYSRRVAPTFYVGDDKK